MNETDLLRRISVDPRIFGEIRSFEAAAWPSGTFGHAGGGRWMRLLWTLASGAALHLNYAQPGTMSRGRVTGHKIRE